MIRPGLLPFSLALLGAVGNTASPPSNSADVPGIGSIFTPTDSVRVCSLGQMVAGVMAAARKQQEASSQPPSALSRAVVITTAEVSYRDFATNWVR